LFLKSTSSVRNFPQYSALSANIYQTGVLLYQTTIQLRVEHNTVFPTPQLCYNWHCCSQQEWFLLIKTPVIGFLAIKMLIDTVFTGHEQG